MLSLIITSRIVYHCRCQTDTGGGCASKLFVSLVYYILMGHEALPLNEEQVHRIGHFRRKKYAEVKTLNFSSIARTRRPNEYCMNRPTELTSVLERGSKDQRCYCFNTTNNYSIVSL
jgi:hypothetical protein